MPVSVKRNRHHSNCEEVDGEGEEEEEERENLPPPPSPPPSSSLRWSLFLKPS